MSKENPSEKNALVVLGESSLGLQRAALKKFQARTIDAIELIARTDRDNVQRRVAVGASLLVVKARIPRGEFLPWLKKHVNGAGYTQCTYFMRAALAFLDSAELTKADLLALTSTAATAQLTKKVQGTKLGSAIATFCGDLTWTELLEAHNIRETVPLGGKRTPGDKPTPTAQDAEQLYLFSRDEISGAIEHAKEVLLKDNKLQHLTGHPEEVAGVVADLRELADKVEAAAKPLLKQPEAVSGKQ